MYLSRSNDKIYVNIILKGKLYMSKIKQFRKGCVDVPEKRAGFIREFIKEDTAVDKPSIGFRILDVILRHKRPIKSNTQTVIDELENYIKTYKNDDIFRILLDSIDSSKQSEVQQIVDTYIDSLKAKTLKYNHDIVEQICPKVDLDKSKRMNRVLCYLTLQSIKDLYRNNESLKESLDISSVDENLKNYYDLFTIVGKNERDDYKGQDFGHYAKETFTMDYFVSFFKALVEKVNIKNGSWSLNEWQEFLENKSGKEIGTLFALETMKGRAGKNNEIDSLFNIFIKKKKKEFLQWNIFNCDSEKYLEEKYKRRCTESFFKGDRDAEKYRAMRKHYYLYTDNDLEVYTTLVDELIERQKDKNVRYIDMKFVGKGITSNVVKIGDYVLKTGTDRKTEHMPNHKRILQPIIREKNENLFFEVADAVDVGAPMEVVDKVFEETLEDGYAWIDPCQRNIGRLRRKNTARNYIYRKAENGYVIDETESDVRATSLYGSVKGDPLEAGEYVIIDTDAVIDLNNISKDGMPKIEGIIGRQIKRRNLTRKAAAMIMKKYNSLSEEKESLAKQSEQNDIDI